MSLDCKLLKKKMDLLRSYTTYSSYERLAKRLTLSDTTLRGYWAAEPDGGEIPDKNVGRFVDLLIEVVPGNVSRATAKALLVGHPLNLLNALSPIGGQTWRQIIEEHQLAPPLNVLTQPPLSLGFGEPDDAPERQPDATVQLGEKFAFQGQLPWRGEGVLIAEHGDEWRSRSRVGFF